LYDEVLVQRVAMALTANQIVGWFQGRMEFGPRALGNRSILANPCNEHIKELLNTRVKHRESFRPYAPVVCSEDASTYFELQQESPFMTLSVIVKESVRHKIPGVVHVDGSARVQTVTQKQNPLLYNLLRAFQRIAGVPILVNTSFNVQGEPIVCSPHDALNTFFETQMDILVLGNSLIDKTEVKACEYF
jgi:carbamoyltransferase